MTDIEQKALALLNECAGQEVYGGWKTFDPNQSPCTRALVRAIEQHEAFRQEVSDAVEEIAKVWGTADPAWGYLRRFIIPKPVDELYECIREALPGSMPDHHAKAITKNTREALAKRGGRIVFDGEKAGE